MINQRDQQVLRVLYFTFFLNLFVCLAKLIYGRWTQSLSLQADGFHSLLDSAGNIVGIVGIWFASKPADAGHPYGHSKAEALASLVIALLIFSTCFKVLHDVWLRYQHPVIPRVDLASFVIMVMTMGINFFVVKYEGKKSRELNSHILHADSVHTASDLFVSMTVLISFVAVSYDLPEFDWVIAMGIIIFLVYAGAKILVSSVNILLDAESINPKELNQVVMSVPGIYHCHQIRSRGTRNGIFVDMNVHVAPALSASDAHELTHRVMSAVKKKFPEVIEVLVHTEPRGHH